MDNRERKGYKAASVVGLISKVMNSPYSTIYIFSSQEYVVRVIELGADSDADGVVSGVSTDDSDEVGADVCLGGWIWAC